MRVQNEVNRKTYKVIGTYFDRDTGIGKVYLETEDGGTEETVTLGQLLSTYKELPPLEPVAEDFGVIATSKLAKVQIADRDYVESGKKHFTWDEACEIEKKLNSGWRLPTRQEWVLICEELGTKDGVCDAETLMKNLGLGKNGLLYSGEDEPSYAGNDGYYWSSTPNSSSGNAYYLYFGGANDVSPSSSSTRYTGRSVRLVKDSES